MTNFPPFEQFTLFDKPQPTRAYFNTTNSPDVAKRNAKALSKNVLILQFFQERPGEEFTAWKLLDNFPGHLITSIRRSLNTLERDGEIVKVKLVMERYGEENFTYKLFCK